MRTYRLSRSLQWRFRKSRTALPLGNLETGFFKAGVSNSGFVSIGTLLFLGVLGVLSGTFGEAMRQGLTKAGAFSIGANFIPHGHCYLWQPKLIWLHVGSDFLISLSYFSIPVALILFASKRREASFQSMFILFGSFICLCGLTHLLAVYNVWNGSYWISGFAKSATAAASLATAVVLFKSLPAALAIPLPREYRKISEKLKAESHERQVVQRRLDARVTEQTKHLWHSDSRWKLLTEFIYSAVWLSDEKGRVNQPMPSWETFTGQSFEEYSGDGWLQAFLESDRDALMVHWQDCVREGKALEYEAHLWSKAKQKHVPIISKGIPIKNVDGAILEWIGAIYDLSEIKRQEVTLASYLRRLQAKNKYLQEFAHVASHDLREPLRKIQAYGDILKEDYHSLLPDEGKNCVDVMQNAANRMSTLIDELLNYSRASSVDLCIENIDLAVLIDRVVDDLEVAISESGAQVERGPLSFIDADAIHLQRVLQNLIGNAIKYRDKDRKPIIRVTSRVVDDTELTISNAPRLSKNYTKIEIRDNGIGFDTRHASRIMKPFQRLHDRNKYPGSGMGLAICKQVVERHNGYLLADSRLGEGSSFTIYLPILD